MNRIVIYILILRYVVVYVPLFFFNGSGYERNEIPYDAYTICHYVGRAIFIGLIILSLSFFTKIKQLKTFIYYRAVCELFETVKLLFIMLAIENTIIHNSELWEWKLGIFINIAAAIYCFCKWKKYKIGVLY